MTELLIKLFVKNSKDTKDVKVRLAYGNLAGIVGILCNVLLFVGKYLIGTIFGSIAIAADAINNLSDASSNIVSLIGFKLGSKKADEEHPFGHARYEYLAGLVVCVIIVAIGLSLAKESILKVIHPSEVDCNALMIVVMLISIAVKLWMSIFNKKIGTRIESDTLIATAADSRNDVLTTTAVLIAALIEHATGWKVDGIMGILVSVFILWSGIGLARDTISPLLGEGVKSDFRKELTEEIMTYPMVLGCHDLMVHDYGPGKRYASIHVEFDKDDNLMACHEVVDQIERKCLEEYGTNLVIHLDPVITDDVEINRMQKLVKQWLVQKDSRLAMHDFRIHSCDDKVKVVFDLMIPDELQGKEEEIKESLENFLNQGEGEEYQADITFDPEADW